MKIVALDALQLMDMDWSALKALDEGMKLYDATAPELVVERAKDADVVLVNKVKLTREVIEQLPKLKYVGVLATGFDNVDGAAAREKGITVTNVPGYSTDSVAQLIFALILELCHQTGHHSDTVKAGRWANQPYYCYWDSPLIELAGKTLGIFGMGKIGQRTALVAQAFGMKVIYCSRSEKNVPGAQQVDFDTLLAQSDIISLSCPLTDATRGLMNAAAFAKMKKTAWLINTSRGGVIVEDDLRKALDEGVIGAAAVDVLSTEPPKKENPLPGAKNIVITPHIAWATVEARTRLVKIVYENLCAWRDGNAQNVVNKG